MTSPTASTVICPVETADSPPPLFQNGRIVFQLHYIGWIVTGAFTLIATLTSCWLIGKHLQWYTNKREQRYIIRILVIVPIYAIISFMSYLFWNHATPLILIRDAYEAIVITAFFYLLLVYISPDPEEQKRVFLKSGLSRSADREAKLRGEKPRPWVFPLRFLQWKPLDGLYFLQLMKWGILQYCVIRPLSTFVAVMLDYMGLYCEQSWRFGWGHVYIVVLMSISVSIAMYCLIQLYVPVSKNLAHHKPLLKLFAIKAIVFLTFWQATFLSLLSMVGVVKDTKYMTADDINIGIGAIIETFEMMLFSLLHIRGFTYKVYQPVYDPKSPATPPVPTSRIRSFGHAMDFRETIREIWVGCIYMLDKIRSKQPTPDLAAWRNAHYESAFGRPRSSPHHLQNNTRGSSNIEKGRAGPPWTNVAIEEYVQPQVDVIRQKTTHRDGRNYLLKYPVGHMSEGLGEQIETELQKLGYTANTHAILHPSSEHDQNLSPRRSKRTSWWRNVYSRISQHELDREDEHHPNEAAFLHHDGKGRSRSRSNKLRLTDVGRTRLHEYRHHPSDSSAAETQNLSIDRVVVQEIPRFNNYDDFNSPGPPTRTMFEDLNCYTTRDSQMHRVPVVSQNLDSFAFSRQNPVNEATTVQFSNHLRRPAHHQPTALAHHGKSNKFHHSREAIKRTHIQPPSSTSAAYFSINPSISPREPQQSKECPQHSRSRRLSDHCTNSFSYHIDLPHPDGSGLPFQNVPLLGYRQNIMEMPVPSLQQSRIVGNTGVISPGPDGSADSRHAGVSHTESHAAILCDPLDFDDQHYLASRYGNTVDRA